MKLMWQIRVWSVRMVCCPVLRPSPLGITGVGLNGARLAQRAGAGQILIKSAGGNTAQGPLPVPQSSQVAGCWKEVQGCRVRRVLFQSVSPAPGLGQQQGDWRWQQAGSVGLGVTQAAGLEAERSPQWVRTGGPPGPAPRSWPGSAGTRLPGGCPDSHRSQGRRARRSFLGDAGPGVSWEARQPGQGWGEPPVALPRGRAACCPRPRPAAQAPPRRSALRGSPQQSRDAPRVPRAAAGWLARERPFPSSREPRTGHSGMLVMGPPPRPPRARCQGSAEGRLSPAPWGCSSTCLCAPAVSAVAGAQAAGPSSAHLRIPAGLPPTLVSGELGRGQSRLHHHELCAPGAWPVWGPEEAALAGMRTVTPASLHPLFLVSRVFLPRPAACPASPTGAQLPGVSGGAWLSLGGAGRNGLVWKRLGLGPGSHSSFSQGPRLGPAQNPELGPSPPLLKPPLELCPDPCFPEEALLPGAR
ncbi:calcium channel flower homolog isoform X1 [Herpailurus yagouaroundi]|uniref:calcium channel flower homolog isoform X1 n=1 Tax=Herpailurus yagouaroundi TaxID=1608482 RepID=UPI001AD6DEF8|nr:calcium channel flower homolog isoform X1 [Puma yagouaroundi]